MDLAALEQETPLSVREEKRLAELEQIIQDNFRGFVAVGQALAEIRDSRLYRVDYPTFEDYCRDLWDMSHRRADQLIAAKSVIDNLTTIVVTDGRDNLGTIVPKSDDNLATIVATPDGEKSIDILPANEAQARELARLQPEEQVKVWSDLLHAARMQSMEKEKPVAITAKAVKKAVLNFKGEKLEVAIKQAVREPSEHRTEFESEEFTAAFQAFITQIDIERRAGWRRTSRKSCHKALLTVLEAVADAGTQILECGCSMDLSEREKLQKAGFSIFRMNAKITAVEKWLHNDMWAVHSEHESPTEMNEAFKSLMSEHTNLRG
ncbi:MAG: hypothetical protein ACYCYR_09415 [Desulfobulbaceae bacterium]